MCIKLMYILVHDVFIYMILISTIIEFVFLGNPSLRNVAYHNFPPSGAPSFFIFTNTKITQKKRNIHCKNHIDSTPVSD